MKKILFFIILTVFSLINPISAQFTVTNSFRSTNLTGLKIGDDATLTAATGVDPDGDGWLRLTKATANQKGYLYVQKEFPTDSGVLADFEYKSWRSTNDGYSGADGFTIFLFDGDITEGNFKLGGYGGSLGYSPNIGTTTNGLSGGYIGIGFDEYGNFSNPNEGRIGGPGSSPNAIVLRGPTTGDPSTTNPYLISKDLGDRTGGANEIRGRDEIDYNTLTNNRPADSIFYRRVQVSVSKVGSDYLVTVKLQKQGATAFTTVINYTMNGTKYPLPKTLKLGFAGSTGGGYNYHEIRNILLTTPGNIRVDSRADSALLCNDIGQNPVTFKIEVTNDSAANLNSIDFTNQIQDSAGNLLDISKFKISELSISNNFTSSTLPTSNFTSNNISGKVGLAAKTSGIITIKGNYFKRSLPTNQSFKSVSTVNTTEVTDSDLTNNTATTVVNVRRCNILTNPSMPSYNK